MNTIGFKTNTQIQKAEVIHYSHIEEKGMIEALETLQNYFNNYHRPLLSGKQRDDFFFEQLKKIRERYFAPL